jgi:SAM-dependent methyltransferase
VTATWEGEKGRFWAAHADGFSRQLGGFLPPILEGADLRPGERVLDVGCGCGDLSIAAGRAVGSDGSVVGIDLSADEVAVALQRVADAELDNVTFEVGDAGAVRVAPPADVLVSRFGVMFFPDPVATFTHLRALLVDGGRLAFAAWTRYEDNTWLTVPSDAIATVVEPAPTPGGDQPGPFAFGDADRVRQVLGGAGFSDIRLDEVVADVDYGNDLDATVAFIRQMDHTRATLDHHPEDVQDEAMAKVRAALEAHVGPDGIRLPGHVWLVRART